MTERGYNQSELIAQSLGRSLNISVDAFCVERIKDTETQTNKTRSQRVDNMQDAFRWHKTLSGKKILLSIKPIPFAGHGKTAFLETTHNDFVTASAIGMLAFMTTVTMQLAFSADNALDLPTI